MCFQLRDCVGTAQVAAMDVATCAPSAVAASRSSRQAKMFDIITSRPDVELVSPLVNGFGKTKLHRVAPLGNSFSLQPQ